MYVPPTDPRDRPATKEPSWDTVLSGYVLLVAIFALLWLVSNPVTGSVVLGALAGLAVVRGRAMEVVRCVRDCPAFAVDLIGDVRVTVRKNATETDLTTDAKAETPPQSATCC